MEPDAPPLDRFIVFSILEDLSLHPVPHPHDLVSVVSKFAVPEDHEPNGEDSDTRDDNLLTAGSSGDPNDEPAAAKIARCKAMVHLAVLSKRLGPLWTNSELVRYLLRCVQEDDADLAVAVARVVHQLVTPYAGLSKPPVPQSAVQQLVSLKQLAPLLVALATSTSEEAREFCIVETIPRCIFGVSFESFANLFSVNTTHHHRDSTLAHHLWPKPPTDVFDRLMRRSKLTANLETFHRHVAQATEPAQIPGGYSPIDVCHVRCQILMDHILLVLRDSKWTNAHCSFVRLLFLLVGVVHAARNRRSGLSSSMDSSSSNEALQSNVASRVTEMNLVLSHVQQMLQSTISNHEKDEFSSFELQLIKLFEDSLFVKGKLGSHHQDPATGLLHDQESRWKPLLVRNPSTHTIRFAVKQSHHVSDSSSVVATLLRSVVWMVQGGTTSSSSSSSSSAPVVLLEQWLSLFSAALDSSKDVFVANESAEAVAYKNRHDDSYAGSHFSVLDAVHHGLIGVLDASRLPTGKDHPVYTTGLCANVEEHWVPRSDDMLQASADNLQRILSTLFAVLSSVFRRGANYSQWKSRLLTARQGPTLVRQLFVFLATVVTSDRWKAIETTTQISRIVSAHFGELVVQQLLNSCFVELLSGDCEEEVRSESVVRIATVVQHLQMFVHIVQQAPRGYNPLFFRHPEDAERVLFEAADAALFCIEQTAADSCDRVRSSAATAVTKLLLCFVTEGSPRDPLDDRSSLSQRAREVLLGLLQDSSFVVQLSVIGQIGDLLVANANSNHSARKSALHDDVCIGVTRLLEILRGNSIWRVREKCSLMCSAMFASFYFRGDQLLRTFALQDVMPVIMELLFDPVKAVRDATIATLVSDLRGNHYHHNATTTTGPHSTLSSRTSAFDDDRQGFINNWLFPAILNHPKSHATYLFRSSLVAIAWSLNVDHETHLFPLLDRLSRDSVLNVRLVVASSIGDVLRKRSALLNGGAATTNDDSSAVAVGGRRVTTDWDVHLSKEEAEGPVLSLLQKLVEDPSVDVRERASNALKVCV